VSGAPPEGGRLAEEQAAFPAPPDADDPFEMTGFYPRTSGLPVTVWTGPRGRVRHHARVKVCRVPGNRNGETDGIARAQRLRRI
jgi:hypothetical protein